MAEKFKHSRRPKEEPQGPTWFDKMGDALQWKVCAPTLQNPFAVPISDRVLIEYSKSEAARRKACDVRCLCDGHEVLNIKNLHSPHMLTSHPCISVMSKAAILEHIDRSPIKEYIQSELDKFLHEVEEELDRRNTKDIKESAEHRETRHQAKKHKKHERDKAGEGSSIRVIRM